MAEEPKLRDLLTKAVRLISDWKHLPPELARKIPPAVLKHLLEIVAQIGGGRPLEAFTDRIHWLRAKKFFYENIHGDNVGKGNIINVLNNLILN
jgi:hypothetical protein